jgi:hypothetical protein
MRSVPFVEVADRRDDVVNVINGKPLDPDAVRDVTPERFFRIAAGVCTI